MITLDSRMTLRRAGRRALLFALVLGALLLAACQRGDSVPWQLTNVTGHMPDLDFSLVDDHGKAVTEITPERSYSRAEDYQQHYFANHPNQGYCAVVVAPKVAKFKKTFASRVAH